ncbi:hypothetical protein [Polaromonas sp.]|uniref:hypothetical protein n=1 Tax=Polaromonas sp. TaxID=1869339 RepID=UPI00286C4F36|nr:hypothetical protein [Polaromonas sp.]
MTDVVGFPDFSTLALAGSGLAAHGAPGLAATLDFAAGMKTPDEESEKRKNQKQVSISYQSARSKSSVLWLAPDCNQDRLGKTRNSKKEGKKTSQPVSAGLD